MSLLSAHTPDVHELETLYKQNKLPIKSKNFCRPSKMLGWQYSCCYRPVMVMMPGHGPSSPHDSLTNTRHDITSVKQSREHGDQGWEE